MKKQLLAAFLCGLVIPLALIAVGMGSKTEQIPLPSEEPEQTQAQIQPQEEYDTQTEVALEQDGQSAAMPLRDYLVGVVLAEMPADFQPEALQAQAVVARTYTCKRAPFLGIVWRYYTKSRKKCQEVRTIWHRSTGKSADFMAEEG